MEGYEVEEQQYTNEERADPIIQPSFTGQRQLTIEHDLEEADNGSTTYYGGRFRIRDVGQDYSETYYFYGSDRESSPAEQILYRLNIDWNVRLKYDEDNKIIHNMNELLIEGKSICLLVDDNDAITQAEPII